MVAEVENSSHMRSRLDACLEFPQGNERERVIDPHWAEVGHRVGSSLQIVASLAHRAEALIEKEQDWAAAVDTLRSIRCHIMAIIAIQRLLYDTKMSQNATRPLLEALMVNLQTIYDRPNIRLQIDATTNIPMTRLHDASLILCELMANALRHGFQEGQRGLLKVGVKAHGPDTIRLSVTDNGVGCPANLEYRPDHGLGLIVDLAEGAGGRLERLSHALGTAWQVDLPSR